MGRIPLWADVSPLPDGARIVPPNHLNQDPCSELACTFRLGDGLDYYAHGGVLTVKTLRAAAMRATGKAPFGLTAASTPVTAARLLRDQKVPFEIDERPEGTGLTIPMCEPDRRVDVEFDPAGRLREIKWATNIP